ncbi:MAG: hypothetical protein AAGA18_08160 [Verrucomicrobiota bacterium]
MKSSSPLYLIAGLFALLIIVLGLVNRYEIITVPEQGKIVRLDRYTGDVSVEDMYPASVEP